MYFLLPLITGLIGWGTNYLAVRMIFRPRREIKLGRVKIIGLIPKRRHEIAIKIADTVEKELISYNDIKDIIESPDFQTQTEELIKRKIEEIIERKDGFNTLMFLMGNSLKNKIVENIMIAVKSEIGEIIDKMFGILEEKLDFRKIVKEKIDSFDLVKLENIIYSIASKELRTIEILGGIIGFLVGIVQVILILITKNGNGIG